MTRSRFLGLFAGLLGASVGAAAMLSSPAAKPSRPRVGHIYVGMSGLCTGDWVPLLDGNPLPVGHHAMALDDIEGWYDRYDHDRNRHGEIPPIRVYGNVSVRYIGNDPRWAAFKDPTEPRVFLAPGTHIAGSRL